MDATISWLLSEGSDFPSIATGSANTLHGTTNAVEPGVVNLDHMPASLSNAPQSIARLGYAIGFNGTIGAIFTVKP
jgi:hypothetical protein